MDNYPILYTNNAIKDLRDIYDYISIDLKSPDVAAVQIKRILNEIRSLSLFPKMFKTVEWEPWSNSGMHQMPVDNFIVFYIADDIKMSVQIIRVIYGKRDIPGLIQSSEKL